MDIFPIKLCVCPSTITFGAVVAYWHTSTPTTVPTSTRPSLISPSYSGSLLDVVGSMQRRTANLELARGSAYKSGRAQGNLYAT